MVGPRRFKLNNIITFSGKYIYTDGNTPVARNVVNGKHVDRLLKTFSIICTAILMSYHAIIIGPVYAYVHDGLRINALGTHLPFFELGSDADFYVNMIIVAAVGVFTMLGGYSLELLTAIVNNTIAAMPDLINLGLAGFFEEYKANGINSNSVAQFRNVFVQIQDFNELKDTQNSSGKHAEFQSLCRYMRETTEVFYSKLFVGPFIFSISISLAIFAQVVLKYPAGIGAAICCFVQLLLLCYMGSNLKEAVRLQFIWTEYLSSDAYNFFSL